MIRKCCLFKDHLQEKRLSSSSYYTKKSPINVKNAKSGSARKVNNSKRHDSRLQQQSWKMLLNQIGQIKDKIIRFTNEYSPQKTPKKIGKAQSFNQRNYASSDLTKKDKNSKDYSLSGKRALRQERQLLNQIDLNCPMSDSVFPMQNSCMLSRQPRQPITDFINGYCNSKQINFPKDQSKCVSHSHYSLTNGPNLGHISLVIDSKLGKSQNQSKNIDIDQLGKKIKKLQKKNNYLTQEKVMLQQRLLIEQQEKRELKKMIFAQDDKVQESRRENYDFVCISTPKRSSQSPIAKYGIKKNQKEKSPYQAIKDKLGASNYSRDIIRKLITQSNNSSPQSLTKYKANERKDSYRAKNQMQFQRLKPENISSIKTMQKIANNAEESDFHSRIQDFSDFLVEKQNQRVFESRKTSKNSHVIYDGSEAQQTNIHRSKATKNEKSRGINISKCSRRSGNQQISDSKERTKDLRDNFPRPIIVQSNIRIENPQPQQRFSPRITFSREAIPMLYTKNGGNKNQTSRIERMQRQLESSEVTQIHKKADSEKLKMLEIYFERLIQFSRQEQNREKKNKIRKEMSEIALQIQQLRDKLEC